MHFQHAENGQFEALQSEFWTVRDNGKSTPTRSVDGDADETRDNRDSDAVDAPGGNDGAEQEANTVWMEDACPPSRTKLHVELGKRRCMGPDVTEALSVEVVSAGIWHCTSEQCKDLISKLEGNVDGHIDADSLDLWNGGLDGGPDSAVESQG